MKFNIYKSVAMCSLLALAGCHDFEELNTDPYAPIYDPTVANVSPDGIDIDYELSESALKSIKGMEGAIGVTLANFLYEGAYNDYQTHLLPILMQMDGLVVAGNTSMMIVLLVNMLRL